MSRCSPIRQRASYCILNPSIFSRNLQIVYIDMSRLYQCIQSLKQNLQNASKCHMHKTLQGWLFFAMARVSLQQFTASKEAPVQTLVLLKPTSHSRLQINVSHLHDCDAHSKAHKGWPTHRPVLLPACNTRMGISWISGFVFALKGMF